MNEDDLIHQADALINRHRPHLPQNPQVPAEEDVPVLTEVVEAAQDIEFPASNPQPPAPDPLLAARAALAHELEVWLDERLTEVVTRVLDGLTDQLIGQIAAQARLELLPRLKRVLDSQQKSE